MMACDHPIDGSTPCLHAWRVLAVLGRSVSSADKLIPSIDIGAELAGADNCEVQTLSAPILSDLQNALATFAPNILYFWAGTNGQPDPAVAPLQSLELAGDEFLPEDLADLLAGRQLDALVYNARPDSVPFADVRQHVKHVVHWPADQDVSALNAATFALCLFGYLRQPTMSWPEAVALANHVLRAHGSAGTGARREPVLAVLDSDTLPELPGTKPLSTPTIPGMDLSQGISRSVAGWESIRLLSPMAECPLTLASTSSILDVERLAALGLALRALCCLEARQAQIVMSYTLQGPAQHTVHGTDTVRAIVAVPCGARFPLLIGAPPAVTASPALLQAAVQATLSYDAISLRFQLPPHGSPAPEGSEDPAVGHGCRCTAVTLISSVWVMHVLRHIAASPHARALALLGVAAASAQPVLAFLPEDALRFRMMQSQQPPLSTIPQLTHFRFNQGGGPPPAALDMNLDAALRSKGLTRNGKSDRSGVRETKFDELTANAASVEQWTSKRPPLAHCTQQMFLDDLAAFHATRFGWSVDRNDFPNAVLNGSSLDLFNLYKAVVARGGFKQGNAINWKGEIFTKMSNWTEDHKMTGVGNALKRHYHRWLWEYERANQRDLVGDRSLKTARCALCGLGDEAGSDWITCGTCHRRVHAACDPRGVDVKALEAYGAVYECIECSKFKQTTPSTAQAVSVENDDSQRDVPVSSV